VVIDLNNPSDSLFRRVQQELVDAYRTHGGKSAALVRQEVMTAHNQVANAVPITLADLVAVESASQAILREFRQLLQYDRQNVAEWSGPARLNSPQAAEQRLARTKVGDLRTLELKTDVTLDLPAGQDQCALVARYLAEQLGIKPPKSLRAEPIRSGRSGALVFLIKQAGTPAAIFKIYARPVELEQEIVGMKACAHLRRFKIVADRGVASVNVAGQVLPAMLMELAPGRSVRDLILGLPAAVGVRTPAIGKLCASVRRIGEALAELHNTLAPGRLLTLSEKEAWSDYVLVKLRRAATTRPEVAAEIADTVAKLEQEVVPKFLAADVPAIVFHGDANLGNFMVARDGAVRVVDLPTMALSWENGRVIGNAAIDIGKFMQNLAVFVTDRGAGLRPEELVRLESAFLEGYDGLAKVKASALAPGITIARAELEAAVINYSQAPRAGVAGGALAPTLASMGQVRDEDPTLSASRLIELFAQ
jgi:aminoglycoside phosphotransferase (APT) family kinase protein